MRRITERAAKGLPGPPEVLELDVNRDEDFEALARELGERWGGLDGAVHAVAHAPPDAIGGNFLSAPRESAKQAFETSAYSLKALGAALGPLMEPAGRADPAAASSGSTSTPRSPGRRMTGWVSRRRPWSRSPAIWRASSAQAASAST